MKRTTNGHQRPVINKLSTISLTLIEMADKPMLLQGERLDEIFEQWRGNNPQVDDVTLIGVRY